MPQFSDVFTNAAHSHLRCIACKKSSELMAEQLTLCKCGGLIEVVHPIFPKEMKNLFDERVSDRGLYGQSGVWRFAEAIFPVPEDFIVSHPEGNTRLYKRKAFDRFAGLSEVALKHEGENPTGSFKDRGMTVAVSHAAWLKKRFVACASTGNTSASLASYAAQAESMKALVFLPKGKVSAGKIAQAKAYGSVCVEIAGDFDEAMSLVRQAAKELGIYLTNSVNPFRPEGQKTIMWEMLQQRNWQAPDWVVVPGGNLGNTSAFGKALKEAFVAGWISKLPKIAVIQAQGASPFYNASQLDFKKLEPVQANTIATAIQIGNPVNFHKAKQVVQDLNGVVCSVTDTQIKEAKAVIDSSGVGCEPASACSLAGMKKLTEECVIHKNDQVVGILTGHLLKDTECATEIAESSLGKYRSVELRNGVEELKSLLV